MATSSDYNNFLYLPPGWGGPTARLQANTGGHLDGWSPGRSHLQRLVQLLDVVAVGLKKIIGPYVDFPDDDPKGEWPPMPTLKWLQCWYGRLIASVISPYIEPRDALSDLREAAESRRRSR